MIDSPKILWKASPDGLPTLAMTQLINKAEKISGKKFNDAESFYQWSIDEPNSFWPLVIEDAGLIYQGSLVPVNTDYSFSTYGWFPSVKISLAENLLANGESNQIALSFVHETGAKSQLTYRELRQKVAMVAEGLKQYIGPGDVVAAYMPNISETVIMMLAAQSLGAQFTSTSCDFGIEGVVDRFGQAKPKVLVAATGYTYNGRYFSQREKIYSLMKKLPSVQVTVTVNFLSAPFPQEAIEGAIDFEEFQKSSNELTFYPTNFQDPLYIMYSSGTTGKPKCIVHSVGGTLLQHVKEIRYHTDVKKGDTLFFFTTCGWMMWNWLVSGLQTGAKIVLYEGSPAYPSMNDYLRSILDQNVTHFGTSPKFLRAFEESGEAKKFQRSLLRSVLCTGAPLSPEQFDFIQSLFGPIQVASISGGTDIIGCFFLGNPLKEVKRGYLQGRGLGLAVACFNEEGQAIVDQEGELVCLKSFPSRPLYFLDDPDGKKIQEAYFDRFSGVWHHGDYVLITSDGHAQVLGRSDATLNPGGVRIGTSEIYRQVEGLPYIEDSVCVGFNKDSDVQIVLAVQLKNGETLSEKRIAEIKKAIREKTTPRHVPHYILPVQSIPYTRSGKKMELAVAKILNGKEISNREAMVNPESVEEIVKLKSSLLANR